MKHVPSTPALFLTLLGGILVAAGGTAALLAASHPSRLTLSSLTASPLPAATPALPSVDLPSIAQITPQPTSLPRALPPRQVAPNSPAPISMNQAPQVTVNGQNVNPENAASGSVQQGDASVTWNSQPGSSSLKAQTLNNGNVSVYSSQNSYQSNSTSSSSFSYSSGSSQASVSQQNSMSVNDGTPASSSFQLSIQEPGQ